MKTIPTPARRREIITYMIRRRSIVALICGIFTLLLGFYGIIAGINKTIAELNKDAFYSFIYYTMLVNTMAALSVSFIIPYAIDGIKKERFTLPGWISMMQYLATSSICIMLVFVFAFMSWASPDDAFGGSNIVTHVFCPTLILIAFFQIENGYRYRFKDMLMGGIPYYAYIVIYFIEVVIIGEENGGWPDIYHITDYLNPLIAVPLLLLFGFGISALVAATSNMISKRREAKLFCYWDKDADPVDVLIEAYALGIMTGKNSVDADIRIPIDVLSLLAKRYGLNVEDLIKPFIKGFQIGLKEKHG